MERIGETVSFLDIPKDRIVVQQGIPWSPDIACQIRFQTSAVPRFTNLGLQLHFIKNGEPQDTAFFGNQLSFEPLRDVGVDIETLVKCLEEGSGKYLRDMVSLGANHAFTPRAKVEIARFKRNYGIFLMIDSWRGLYQVKPRAFKASLGL